MSMTKRYLESLPADEQDAILGRPDEWDDDAENEPTDAVREWLDARFSSRLAGIAEEAEEELAEWARALMEEEEEDERDVDRFIERDEAQLVKPQPVGVKLDGYDI